MLLLATCEQTRKELDRADVAVAGLGAELEALSARVRDELGQDRWKAPVV
jgi:hypothetical protein